MTTYNRTYKSVPESEEIMLDELRSLLLKHDIDGPFHYSISLVISEAYTNAYVHGNHRDPNKNIFLELDINKDYVKADITDEGKSGLEYIKHRRPPELLSEGGRGIDLMEIYADSVDFWETETGGLKVSLQFNRTVNKKKADVSKSL